MYSVGTYGYILQDKGFIFPVHLDASNCGVLDTLYHSGVHPCLPEFYSNWGWC